MAIADRVVRKVEELEALDRAARPLAAAAGRATQARRVKNALSGTWLGHPLHPMLTDVPIGGWIAAGVLDLAGGAQAARAARCLVGFGVLAAIPTAAAGLSDWSDTYGAEQRVGLVHAAGNVTALSLQVASYLARRRGRRGAGVMLSATGLGIMAGAGYLGGHLSFTRGVGVNHTAFQDGAADWTRVALLSELAPDKLVRVMAGGVPVLLVRRGEQVRALSATCGHAGGPLDEGELADGCVRCPRHGSMFRLSDGAVVRGPAVAGQPTWQVRIDGEQVQVRAGQP
ncbi:MAG TPA: DUF2231 domain-containing protein [Streptosporangiaceae bacterium]|nr:DUF2231 domain-containing protein [Streptosporangiaceae bacterium]